MLGSALLFSLGTTVNAQEMKPTYWQDLVPQVERVADPFAALDSNQLYDLGTIARYEASLNEPGFKPSEEAKKNIAEIRANLKKQGIDVDHLFSMREQIKQQRMRRPLNRTKRFLIRNTASLVLLLQLRWKEPR
ncbi:hypothetical protein JCM19236_5648 [Vibrio sp. JCM 19236]|nr:hypothetical protein JCM19236_5648 [Vibrio sp. JCM 19236]